MKERPILFSASMVRALLAGTKTQTRRVCKPATTLSAVVEVPDPLERGQVYSGSHFGDEDGGIQFASPYGGIGDRLWVRETWRIGSWDDGYGFWIDYCDGPRKERLECQDVDLADRLIEQTGEDLRKCDFQPTNGTMYEWAPGQSPLRWRPSIHMPRWASRITLQITGVRVERLHDISEADAAAEGVHTDPACPAYDMYQALWEQINGPASWEENPWVWVVEFRRIKP